MSDQDQRKDYMGVLARARPDRLAALLPDLPDHTWLRAPEIGTTMVRGRVGASGAPFNLGEMTVTRCTLQLADGAVGHAYVQGRDKGHATRAALIDALIQSGQQPEVTTPLLTTLRTEETERRRIRDAKAAATKVEFFTMVRGED
ncbi:phosphonate C-P lyase system protein PhnG [Donghicola sp. B5-SW-15]|uniref:Phosphonate C-P lyase system protein PhnG n=1 Tax=Donghicola mangrovi TaxID=2729614 RepID=A0A850Q8L0_9RHOB|nr:phosphonate C-P lyase system protein PhnG [Donghicola mangrovi]